MSGSGQQHTATYTEAVLKYFQKRYHSAMSAAFLCDAAFYTFDAESEAHTANEQHLSDMAADLQIDVWADAAKVCQCQHNLTRVHAHLSLELFKLSRKLLISHSWARLPLR